MFLGNILLLAAIETGDVEKVKTVLGYNADPNVRKWSESPSPLKYACDYLSPEGVLKLLKAGTDPNLTNAVKVSPLMLNVKKGREEITRILLDFGADFSAEDLHGNQALNIAVSKVGDEFSLDCVEMLLSKGSDPNHVDTDGYSPLAKAVQCGNTSCLTLLIQYGAKVNPRHPREVAPLIVATQELDYAATDILLSHEADPNICESVTGYTPIFYTVSRRNILHENPGISLEVMKLLIEFGASCTVQDSQGLTPLHVACAHEHHQSGWYNLVETLLEAAPDSINVPEYDIGNTPLTSSLLRLAGPDSLPCIELLISHGASVKILDTLGKSPLYHAITGQWTSLDKKIPVVKLLFTHGAIIDDITRGAEIQPMEAGVSYELLIAMATGQFTESLGALLLAAGCYNNLLSGLRHTGNAVVPLTHICRQAIRTNLMTINLDKRLWIMVGKLPLPSFLISYVVYGHHFHKGK